MVKISGKKDLAIIVLFLSVYAMLHGFYVNGDATFGYAISNSIAQPTLYAPNDLVIGSSGNFLFYRLLDHFPFFKDNFVLRDFLIGAPLALLIMLAWYNILAMFTANRKIILSTLFFILFADDKLYLDGMNVALFSLTSNAAVHFFQLLALLLFFKSRHVASFLLLALTSYLHPASGMVYMAILAGVLSIRAWQERRISMALRPILFGIVAFLPNLLLIKNSLDTASVDLGKFFGIFYTLNGGHAYLEDYFHRGYLYALSILILYAVLRRKRIIEFPYQKAVDWFIALGMIGSGLWLLNLYYIHNLSFFYTYFIGRVFYIARPLLIFIVVVIAANLFGKKKAVSQALALALVVTLFLLSSLVSAVVIMVVLAYYLYEHKMEFLEQRAERYKTFSRSVPRGFYAVVAALVVIFAIASLGYRYNNKFGKIYRLAKGENQFNFSFDKSKNYGENKAHPFYGAFADWAKQFSGKMFIVPPDDQRISTTFRYLTKNSIYVNRYDLGQLSYSPPHYFEGFGRFKEVGVVMRGRGVYDFSGYDMLTIKEARQLDADFIVFDKLSPSYRRQSGERPVYENDKYIVYQLR